MDSDKVRKFVVVTMVDGNSDVDMVFTTEAQLLRELQETAENHYDQCVESYTACVWDIDKNISTIYRYEKLVQVIVTAY